MNVGQNASLRDRDVSQKSCKLVVFTNRQLNMARRDPKRQDFDRKLQRPNALFSIVFFRGLAAQFQNLGAQILKNCGQVNRRRHAQTSCETTVLEIPSHAPNWKVESSAFRLRHTIGFPSRCTSTTHHFNKWDVRRRRYSK